MHNFIRFCKDSQGLLAVQLVLLAMTFVFAAGDAGDLRFQIAYLLFLLPGWLLSPRWTGNHSGLVQQYFHALITSFLIHAWLVAVGVFLGLGFREYFIGFGLVLAAAVVDRFVYLIHRGSVRGVKIFPSELVLWLAVMLLIVVVYRLPRSNDIVQFILQQQDAVVTQMLSPSAIGVSGMGIDRPMPRWSANYWHLWPSLMAVASGLPVRDVLYRYAPIPLALAAMVCCIQTLLSLCGSRVSLWAVVLALFGPVVLWYRDYNAFTYSFRITNSFCLDKDFCLFFLIPAILYLVTRWLGGARHSLPILILSIPAILRFHPMTAVYLVLLTPFVLVGYQTVLPTKCQTHRLWHRMFDLVGSHKSILVTISVLILLAVVIVIGDAQSFHRQIQEVIRIDSVDSLAGRPLHYWVGQYASIREHELALDTSQWTGNHFHLKPAIVSDSGLFLAAHLAWLMWGVGLVGKNNIRQWQRWSAVGIALATLWLIVFVSPIVLGRYPHVIAGYERLHWFAFVPALVSVCCGFSTIFDWIDRGRSRILGDRFQLSFHWIPTSLVAAGLLYSAGCLAMLRPTGLANLRGLNSRLDYELAEYNERVDRYSQRSRGDLSSHKPAFLRDDDRVLMLGGSGDDRYWLMKQSVFWREPYAEAFALHQFGESFLADRKHFYALVDRISDLEFVPNWFDEKGITLIVDRTEGSDVFLDRLRDEYRLEMQKIETGVWRITR